MFCFQSATEIIPEVMCQIGGGGGGSGQPMELASIDSELELHAVIGAASEKK